jgi:hypothetical protein
MFGIILIVFVPPVISLLLVALASRWMWFWIFSLASVALVVGEYLFASSQSFDKSAALIGQHAVLWGAFLLFGIIAKCVSLFLAGRSAPRWAVRTSVAAGFLLPVALIFLLRINTFFW